MRWILVLTALTGVLLATVLAFLSRAERSEPIVLPQSAMPGRLLVGLQDDPSFRWALGSDSSRESGRSVRPRRSRPLAADRSRQPRTFRRPVLELAYYVPTGTHVDVTINGTQREAVPLERDGWLQVPLEDHERAALDLRATDPHGHSVTRTVSMRG